MVKFIVGKADLNISAAVYGDLILQLKNCDKNQNIIFLVPDQIEYETEKAIYKILDNQEMLKFFSSINITTFSKICREIIQECEEQKPFADEIVKNIIMHKTVSENEIGLSALKKIASKQGFSEKMVKTVSMLKTAGITAKDLELSLQAISQIDNSLSDEQPIIKKLNETSILYANYEKLLENYIDKLDITQRAANDISAEKTKMFCNANVFVDRFNDFTQSQLQFLKSVIIKAQNVTFGFTAQLNSDCDVFRTTNNQISRLAQEARENNLEVEFAVEGIESRFAENSPLRGISKYLYQDVKSDEKLNDSCELVTAKNVYSELDYVAAKIKELTLDKNMRYNEIAVLCADINSYGKTIESIFRNYEIPMFLDTAEPILYQPLVNLVISVLNALANYSVDTVLSCVKTQFFPNTNEDNIDAFENYIYEWDLKTSHLKKPFSFKNNRSENDNALKAAENVRKTVAEPLWKLKNKLKDKTDGAKLTELLYDFLIHNVDIINMIKERCKKENSNELDNEKAAFYQRLWNSLVDIFNKLHNELKNTNLSIKEYRDIFRDICASTSLANPPKFIDCVLVGDIDRTRVDNIKAAFIVGASYEAFPTPTTESSIFSPYEMELICDKIVHIDNSSEKEGIAPYVDVISHLGDTDRQEYCLKSEKEQYYLSLYRAYRAVTLPTEYLCISCPNYDLGGEELSRSDIFKEITSTFKNINIINADKMSNKFYCRTLKATKLRYAMGLNENSKDNRILKAVLEKKGDEERNFVKTLDEIREARTAYKQNDNNDEYFSGKHRLNPQTAKMLFPLSMGTTSIEKLNLCKFNYFCEYGLKIKERNQRNFTRNMRGNAIHFVFQNVLEEYSENMDGFFALKRSELISLSKKYLKIYRENETNNDSDDDKRTEYLFNNIANSAADVLITIQTELFVRKYRPKFFELNINDKDNHPVIDNEKEVKCAPPEAEIYTENITETSDTSIKPVKNNETIENAPYIITKPLEIKLNNGIDITVQGIIDRVDMFNANDTNGEKPVAYVRVVDYKSSVHTFDLDLAKNGVNIQMLLYLFALQNANKDNPTLELRPGGVSYIPSKNLGATDEQLTPNQILIRNYHESGLLIKDEITESDYNNYKQYINNKIDKNDSNEQNESKESNVTEATSFNDLQTDIMNKITDNLDDIFKGSIDAIPTWYYTNTANGKQSGTKLNKPCDFCRFKEICQNSETNVNLIEKSPKRNKTKQSKEEKNDVK